MHAYACIHMVKNNKKHYKIAKKVLFSSYTRETHVRLMQEHEEKSRFLRLVVTLVDIQKLVAPQQLKT